jgi:hypothetical protein
MVESRKWINLKMMSNRGQGTIEYILLLVITTSMILLALGQIFRPMQSFLKDFMGTYVACMLSSGELPSIHSENKLKDVDSQCSFKFEGSGSLANNGSSGGGSAVGESTKNGKNSLTDSNAGGNQSNNKNSANNNSKKGSGKGSGSSDSSGGSQSANSFAGSPSRNSLFGRKGSGSTDSGSGLDGDAGAGGKKRYVNGLNKKGDRFINSSNQRQATSANGRGIAVFGYTEGMSDKQERKIQSEARVVARLDEGMVQTAQKKVAIKPPTTVIKIEAKDEEMSLGAYLKYLLIAVIILLIVILGGGQMFEMSKSYD